LVEVLSPVSHVHPFCYITAIQLTAGCLNRQNQRSQGFVVFGYTSIISSRNASMTISTQFHYENNKKKVTIVSATLSINTKYVYAFNFNIAYMLAKMMYNFQYLGHRVPSKCMELITCTIRSIGSNNKLSSPDSVSKVYSSASVTSLRSKSSQTNSQDLNLRCQLDRHNLF